jgi:flagellar basal body rod protein FlgG
LPVLDDRNQPIKLDPNQKTEISQQGEVSQDGRLVATLGIFDGEFEKAGASLWTATNTTLVANAEIATGFLESSNVQPVQAMVDLIRINRAYEMSQKSIHSEDEMTQKLLDSLNR